MPPPRLNTRLSAFRQTYILPPRPSVLLGRNYVTATASTASPRASKRRIRPWIYGIVFGVVGFTAGKLTTYSLLPPPSPAAGTKEDTLLLNKLNANVDKLGIVKELRAKTAPLPTTGEALRVDAQPASVDAPVLGGEWVELQDPFSIGTWTGPQHSKRMLSMFTGFRGLGINRAFWNTTTRELVFVTWFGGSLCGWPGVAHGGMLATLLEEAGFVAYELSEGPDDSAHKIDRELERNPKSLDLTYLRPTVANAFYIIRAKVIDGRLETPRPKTELGVEKDLAKRTASEIPGAKVNCSIESLDGKVYVKAVSDWSANEGTVTRTSRKVARRWWSLW